MMRKGFLSWIVILFAYFYGYANKPGGLNATAGDTYYFSNNGNDSYTASQAMDSATPWRTLEKLNNEMNLFKPGDIIRFKRGDVFYGSLNITKSGLLFSAYGIGVRPVISGFEILSFTNSGANTWESQVLNKKPNIVVEENQQKLPARFPNNGYLYFEQSQSASQFVDEQLTGNWVGGEAVVRKNNTVLDKGIIISQKNDTVVYENINSNVHDNGNGYFIQNHSNAMDVNGEWVFTQNRIRLFSTTAPLQWKAAQTETLVSLNNQFALFDGLTFEGANHFAFNLVNATGTQITNCIIKNSGAYAINSTESSLVLIQDNIISTTNNCAVVAVSSPGIIIRRNVIENTGIEGRGEPLGISGLEYSAITLSRCASAIVELNTIDGVGYNGIHFLFASNILIQKNFIARFNRVKDDGGGIYTWNDGFPDVVNNRIVNNMVVEGTGAPDALRPAIRNQILTHGIYLDANAANILVQGNVIANNAGSGIFIHNCRNIEILKNTVYNNCIHPNLQGFEDFSGQIQFLSTNTATPIRNITIQENQFISKDKNQWVLRWDANANDINMFGAANKNFYARPVDDHKTIRICETACSELTLDEWKNFSGQDAASSKSPKQVSSADSIRFIYTWDNALPVVLNGVWMDMNGQYYTNYIQQPYTANVLVYFAANFPTAIGADVPGRLQRNNNRFIDHGNFFKILKPGIFCIYRIDGALLKRIQVTPNQIIFKDRVTDKGILIF